MKHIGVAVAAVLSLVACGDDDATEISQLPSQSVMVLRADYHERLDVGPRQTGCVVDVVAREASLSEFIDGLDVDHLDDAPEPFVAAVEVASTECDVWLGALESYPR